MSDQRIDDMRAVHFPEEELGQTFCYEDGQHWPCHTAHVLAELAAAVAQNKQLRAALQAEQDWRDLNDQIISGTTRRTILEINEDVRRVNEMEKRAAELRRAALRPLLLAASGELSCRHRTNCSWMRSEDAWCDCGASDLALQINRALAASGGAAPAEQAGGE